MSETMVKYWRCPYCKSALYKSENGKSCYCNGAKKHCFDFAKSGYLNLRGVHTGEGDGKEAVRARRSFLEKGYYEPLSDRVNSLLNELNMGSVLDAGCGEGYYTNRMAKSRDVIGIDLSKDGIDMAAKSARSQGWRASYAVASLFSLPVLDEALDAVTNIFAPCAETEFCRVLKSGGYLILVGAADRHLFGLKEILYENPYLNVGREDLPSSMELIRKETLSYTVTVSGTEQIEALFSMTPYYWRTSLADKEKLRRLDMLTTELAFDIFLFRKDV